MEEVGCIVISVSATGREALVDCGDGRIARLQSRQTRFVHRHDAVRGNLDRNGRQRLYNASRDWWFEGWIEVLKTEAATA
jgi:hypothetical protein